MTLDVIACRYCNEPVSNLDAAETFAYWGGTRDVCHRACKLDGIRQEALDCQTIDADCNDCRHFERGTFATKVRNHQPNVFSGQCLKFNRPTEAFPNKWTGRECFEHRRAKTT